MPLRPTTRTLADVKRSVRRIFGDESSIQIDDGDITNWANEAQMGITERNEALKATSTTSTIVDQAAYSWPTPQINAVDAITYNGHRLRNVEMLTALNELSGNTDATGAPKVWYEYAGEFTLFPTPTEVGELKLYYTRYPDDLLRDTDLLSVPNKFFQAVVDYCLWKAFELDEDWSAAQIKETHYRTALEEQAGDERASEAITYPVIVDVG